MDALTPASLNSSDPKTRVMAQIRQEAAVANARQLIEKINEHCFTLCVPKPGSSLSRAEEGCYSACMEKYMGAWNAVSRAYVARITKEAGSGGMGI